MLIPHTYGTIVVMIITYFMFGIKSIVSVIAGCFCVNIIAKVIIACYASAIGVLLTKRVSAIFESVIIIVVTFSCCVIVFVSIAIGSFII